MSGAPPTAVAAGAPPRPAALAALLGVDLVARTSYGLCRTPLLPLYAASLGASPTEIGLIGAAATAVGIVVKFPAGALSDVVGRAPLLLAGLLVFAGAPHLYPLAGGIAALGLLRVFHGLATSCYSPVSMATVAGLAGSRRGEYLAWLSNTKICGPLCGAVIGGALLEGADETRRPAAFAEAWTVAAALGGVALVLGLLVVLTVGTGAGQGTGRRGAWTRFRRGLGEAAGNRRLVLVSATEGLQNVSVGVLEQFLPIYAVVVAGLGPLEAGALFGVQTVTTVACKPWFGRVSDRRGRSGLVVAGLVVCAVPFAAIPWASGFPALLVLCSVFGVGEALVTAAAAALAADESRERGLGAAMGVFGTIGDVGHAAGPVLAGALLALFGWSTSVTGDAAAQAFRPTLAVVSAALIAMAVAFSVWSRSPDRRPPPVEP